jgi:hypothetical protein
MREPAGLGTEPEDGDQARRAFSPNPNFASSMFGFLLGAYKFASKDICAPERRLVTHSGTNVTCEGIAVA